MNNISDGDTIRQLPCTYKTESIYLPTKQDLASLPISVLQRGMCPRSGRRVSVCRMDCHAPCRWGMELARREEGHEI